jgi:hypothetical protein
VDTKKWTGESRGIHYQQKGNEKFHHGSVMYLNKNKEAMAMAITDRSTVCEQENGWFWVLDNAGLL